MFTNKASAQTSISIGLARSSPAKICVKTQYMGPLDIWASNSIPKRTNQHSTSKQLFNPLYVPATPGLSSDDTTCSL